MISKFVIFAGYHTNDAMQESFIFCKELEMHAAGQCIFMKIERYFCQQGIYCWKCISYCTLEAKAMIGRQLGVLAATRIKCWDHRHWFCTSSIFTRYKTNARTFERCFTNSVKWLITSDKDRFDKEYSENLISIWIVDTQHYFYIQRYDGCHDESSRRISVTLSRT